VARAQKSVSFKKTDKSKYIKGFGKKRKEFEPRFGLRAKRTINLQDPLEVRLLRQLGGEQRSHGLRQVPPRGVVLQYPDADLEPALQAYLTNLERNAVGHADVVPVVPVDQEPLFLPHDQGVAAPLPHNRQLKLAAGVVVQTRQQVFELRVD
jgi:hypothetical protein